MTNTTTQTAFVPIRQAANRLGVPASWLRAEALAGRVPHLRAGRRLLADPEAVRETLAFRASTDSGKGVSHAD